MLELVNILVYDQYTRKHVKPKNSSVADHLLLCNHYIDFNKTAIKSHFHAFQGHWSIEIGG